ncbi:hypothetical protein CRG98_003802 [Punica granatum]|uniref:Uncharacterized protein n=1 Tax=Punica granatum TaxID=22663 RepID=A0A2I0L4X0_PUNGR|nr:hypothetical protein CRG98_003802 [Punica granatum]
MLLYTKIMVEGSDWSGEDSESEFGSDARNETVSDDSEDAACEPGPDECGEEDDEEELMAQLLDRIESGNILNPRDRESQNGGLIMGKSVAGTNQVTGDNADAAKSIMQSQQMSHPNVASSSTAVRPLPCRAPTMPMTTAVRPPPRRAPTMPMTAPAPAPMYGHASMPRSAPPPVQMSLVPRFVPPPMPRTHNAPVPRSVPPAMPRTHRPMLVTSETLIAASRITRIKAAKLAQHSSSSSKQTFPTQQSCSKEAQKKK